MAKLNEVTYKESSLKKGNVYILIFKGTSNGWTLPQPVNKVKQLYLNNIH